MGLFSSSKERGAAAATLAQAKEMAEKAGLVFEQLDPPTQQQLIDSIKFQEEVPEEQAQEIARQDMEILKTDPSLYSEQKDQLAKLSELSSMGLTPEEVMEREMMMNSVAGQEQSRQKAIVQNMNERGVGGSGIEAAQRLQSSQGAANRARSEAMNLEAQKNKRALEAIGQTASLAGQMRGQEFQKASAADQIAQFNAQQRTGAQGRNIAAARDIAKQKSGALDKAYGYDFQKAQAQSGAYGNQANMLGNVAGSQAQAAAQKSAAGMQLIGSAIGAGAGLAASDVNCKKDINPGKEKLDEMYDKLNAYQYKYKNPEKHGEGEQLGIMAQDLEQSELGKQFVVEDQGDNEELGMGTKMIDYGSMAPTIVAAQAEMKKENKDMKSRVEQLENMLNIFRGNREEKAEPAEGTVDWSE